LGQTHQFRCGRPPAFPTYCGRRKRQSESPDSIAGFSPVGSHILPFAEKVPLAAGFVYGDRKTKRTVRWASLDQAKRGDGLEFVGVEPPESQCVDRGCARPIAK